MKALPWGLFIPIQIPPNRYLPLEVPEGPAAAISIQSNSSLSQGLSGSRVGTLGSVSGDPPAASTGETERDHDAPSLPGPRPLAVPGIGFPQNISVGLEVLDPAAFRDLPPLRPISASFGSSPQPRFGFRS